MSPLKLVHRAQLPPLAPGQLAPAVVMVHGWQGDEKVMSVFERTLPPAVAIISPRAPLDMHNAGFGWYEPVAHVLLRIGAKEMQLARRCESVP